MIRKSYSHLFRHQIYYIPAIFLFSASILAAASKSSALLGNFYCNIKSKFIAKTVNCANYLRSYRGSLKKSPSDRNSISGEQTEATARGVVKKGKNQINETMTSLSSSQPSPLEEASNEESIKILSNDDNPNKSQEETNAEPISIEAASLPSSSSMSPATTATNDSPDEKLSESTSKPSTTTLEAAPNSNIEKNDDLSISLQQNCESQQMSSHGLEKNNSHKNKENNAQVAITGPSNVGDNNLQVKNAENEIKTEKEQMEEDVLENGMEEVVLEKEKISMKINATNANHDEEKKENDDNVQSDKNINETNDNAVNVNVNDNIENQTEDHCNNNDEHEDDVSSSSSFSSSTEKTTTPFSQPHGIKLRFDNFVDLQTRLVLLPYQDDECIGATIASYMAASRPMQMATDNIDNLLKEGENDNEANVTGYILTGIPKGHSINKNDSNDYHQSDSDSDAIDWSNKDYTNILSAIRDAPTPTVLQFHDPEEWQIYQESLMQQKATRVDCDAQTTPGSDTTATSLNDEMTISTIKNTFHNNNDDNNNNNIRVHNDTNETVIKQEEDENKNDDNTKSNNNDFKGRFQRWGSHFASEATKAVFAGKEIAREKVSERFLLQQQELSEKENQKQRKTSVSDDSQNSVQGMEIEDLQKHEKKQNEKDDNQTPFKTLTQSSGVDSRNDLCGIFLQTSFGKCLTLKQSLYKQTRIQRSLSGGSQNGVVANSQLEKNGKSNSRRNLFKKAPPTISNTSVLVIRKSATEACPTLGYHYQWYKTSQSQIDLDENSENSDDESSWTLLNGANSVMFQPSVTDVGYRVKCVVTIDNKYVSGTGSQQVGSNSTKVHCELPFVIESDPTLFNAAMKTFVPLSDGAAGMQVSSFGNLVGRDEFEGLQLRVSLYTMRDDGIQGGFYMTFSANTEKPIHDEEKLIVQANAFSYTYKARSFYLLYRFGPLEEFNLLKLKSPSRLARETFLIALGIAKYEGNIANLSKYSVLYPEFQCFTATDNKLSVVKVPKDCKRKCHLHETEEQRAKCLSTIEIDKSSPENSEMMAIESELEQDLATMRDKLEEKNKIVSELHQELTDLHEECKVCKAKHHECKKNLRLSERRIESLESDIQRLKKDFKAHQLASEKKFEEKNGVAHEFEKVIKSMQNEKAVLSAAIEARDNKLANISAQLNEVETLRRRVLDKEKMEHELDDLRQKHKTAIDKMKKLEEKEHHLTNALETSKKDVDRLEAAQESQQNALVAVKTEASKVKLQFQKSRGERNTFKQKADSLSKEMSRICRNGRSINDIEKLIHDHQSLSSEVVQLRSEKKKALDEAEDCRNQYDQYVKAQIQAKSDDEAIKVFQRNMELERVVTEMTEYLNAKQMQLESVQDANRALTEELRLMAEKCRDQNDV